MALIPMWQCDRDQKLFTDKKEAEEHDKMLELAANISYWIEQEITGLEEHTLEALGLLLAENKTKLQIAMKGKPGVLLEKEETSVAADNVTSIAG